MRKCNNNENPLSWTFFLAESDDIYVYPYHTRATEAPNSSHLSPKLSGDLANKILVWQLFRRAMLPLLQQCSLHFMPNMNPLLHSTPLLRNLQANSRPFSPRMTSFSVRYYLCFSLLLFLLGIGFSLVFPSGGDCVFMGLVLILSFTSGVNVVLYC